MVAPIEPGDPRNRASELMPRTIVRSSAGCLPEPGWPFGNTGPVEIDAQLVARLVGSQFPQWSSLPVTAAEPNGWDNRTFRRGSDLLVRLPSAQSYAAQVSKEHRWPRGWALWKALITYAGNLEGDSVLEPSARRVLADHASGGRQ
jgi:hypothetical protein